MEGESVSIRVDNLGDFVRRAQREALSGDMTKEEIDRFDEASNHPYECKCELCLEWWDNVPEEE